MKQTVPLELLCLVVTGHPFAGKTTLVNTMFNQPMQMQTSGLDLHEATIRRNIPFGDSFWFKGSNNL